MFIGLLAVVVHLGDKQVVRSDQHVAALVELFQNGLEFFDCYMVLVIGFGILIPIKSAFRIRDQAAEAEEGHLSGVSYFFQGGLSRLIAGLCLGQLRLLQPVAAVLRQNRYRSVIVIAHGQTVRTAENIAQNLLPGNTLDRGRGIERLILLWLIGGEQADYQENKADQNQ